MVDRPKRRGHLQPSSRSSTNFSAFSSKSRSVSTAMIETRRWVRSSSADGRRLNGRLRRVLCPRC